MKKIMQIMMVFGIVMLLCACAVEPTMFGMPQSQWNQLSKAQQQEVIKGYNRRKNIEEANKPVTTAISTAGAVISQQQQIDQQRESAKEPAVPTWVTHPYGR